MSQSAPGWYQDHDDARLARWWDGERWTEHTLVLDEQDWSTEPDPPQAAASRFPNPDTGEVAIVESDPALGYETDIYAPIRDPWGEADAVPSPTATTAWSDDDVWTGAAAGAGATTAMADQPSWDDGLGSSWTEPRSGGFAGGVAGWPSWAKVGLPIAVLVLVIGGFAISGALGGSDSPATTTSSSSTSAAPNIGEAAAAAVTAAGNDPKFPLPYFRDGLIQATCNAARDASAPSLIAWINSNFGTTDPVTGATATTLTAEEVDHLINGLRAGTNRFCPDDMRRSTLLLDTVKTELLGGAATTTSSTEVTIPGDTTSTTRRSTTTTRRPGTTTTTQATTTSTEATTTTVATTTSTTPTTAPTTSTTQP